MICNSRIFIPLVNTSAALEIAPHPWTILPLTEKCDGWRVVVRSFTGYGFKEKTFSYAFRGLHEAIEGASLQGAMLVGPEAKALKPF